MIGDKKNCLSLSYDDLHTGVSSEIRHLPDRAITDIISEVSTEFPGEAFYLLDLGSVVRQYYRWVRCLPRVQPWFAVKCNPDPLILKTLALLGTGFDCASEAEFDLVLKMKLTSADKIVFANPCKRANHLKAAADSNVRLLTFDNADELRKIARLHSNARVILRILADDSNSVCRFGSKFGAPIEDHEHLLRLAQKLNLEVAGVSFHVGSGCMSADSFVDAIRRARICFDLASTMGMSLKVLDLGGGFPGVCAQGVTLSFEDIASAIVSTLDDLFPEDSGVVIIAEPGRYFVSECATLATTVISRRICGDRRPDEDPDVTPERLVYQNDGCYGSFNCIFFDHNNPMPIALKRTPDEPTYLTTVFGPTCDSLDCIIKCTPLPELVEGDIIYYESMGAYCLCAGSTFNGMDLPRVVYTYSAAERH